MSKENEINNRSEWKRINMIKEKKGKKKGGEILRMFKNVRLTGVLTFLEYPAYILELFLFFNDIIFLFYP